MATKTHSQTRSHSIRSITYDWHWTKSRLLLPPRGHARRQFTLIYPSRIQRVLAAAAAEVVDSTDTRRVSGSFPDHTLVDEIRCTKLDKLDTLRGVETWHNIQLLNHLGRRVSVSTWAALCYVRPRRWSDSNRVRYAPELIELIGDVCLTLCNVVLFGDVWS